MNRFVAFGAVLALVACADTVAPSPDTSQPQTDVYTLTELSGQNLPAHFTNGTQTGVITAGTLLLNADNSYAVIQTGYTIDTSGGITVNSPTATDTAEAGTYQVTGTKIVFAVPPKIPGAGATYTHQGTISGSLISYTDASGLNYEYQLLGSD